MSENKPELDPDVFADVVCRLREAFDKHEAAAYDERIASAAMTAAVNNLNEVQREFDALVKDAHKTAAPWCSDWHSKYVASPLKSTG